MHAYDASTDKAVLRSVEEVTNRAPPGPDQHAMIGAILAAGRTHRRRRHHACVVALFVLVVQRQTQMGRPHRVLTIIPTL
jgi:hypothetical protein